MNDKEANQSTEEERLKKIEEENTKALDELYNEEMIQQSNQMFESMTEEELEELQDKAKEILVLLKNAYLKGNPESAEAKELAVKHREWLSYTWPEYTIDMHRELGKLYATDEGLVEYYEKAAGEGAADFFEQTILIYTSNLDK